MFTFWKEIYRNKDHLWYRFQTDISKVHTVMKGRKKFRLAGIGVNCKLWVYRAQFKNLAAARKEFNDIKKIRRKNEIL